MDCAATCSVAAINARVGEDKHLGSLCSDKQILRIVMFCTKRKGLGNVTCRSFERDCNVLRVLNSGGCKMNLFSLTFPF